MVILTLAIILAANTLSKKLLPSLLLGALLLALWSGHGFSSIVEISIRRSISVNNLMLVLTVSQVMWLSRQMQASGVMAELATGVKRRVSKRGAMAALPALIGFLPMPGGALFSAPMLESCDPQNLAGNALKAQTNHWFRHVWECWWPMFPGVLLTMELTGFDVPQMIMLGMPVSLFAILFGYLLLLRRIPDASENNFDDGATPPSGPGMVRLMEPVIAVILTYGAVRLVHGFISVRMPSFPDLNRYLPMCIGLFIAMALLQVRRPVERPEWAKILFSGQVLNMVLIILAVRIYGAFIEAESMQGQGCLIERMRMELTAWKIPLTAVIMLLPFLTGLATGMAIGYIGASFPIVLSLIGEDPAFGEMLSMTVLAYGAGYMGFLLSPVHICLVVSSRHFNTSVLRNMAGLLPPALLVMLSTVFVSMLWRILLL